MALLGCVQTLLDSAFAPPRKSYGIGLLFTYRNDCGGTISVTERSCATSSLKQRVTYRIAVHTITDNFEPYSVNIAHVNLVPRALFHSFGATSPPRPGKSALGKRVSPSNPRNNFEF